MPVKNLGLLSLKYTTKYVTWMTNFLYLILATFIWNSCLHMANAILWSCVLFWNFSYLIFLVWFQSEVLCQLSLPTLFACFYLKLQTFYTIDLLSPFGKIWLSYILWVQNLFGTRCINCLQFSNLDSVGLVAPIVEKIAPSTLSS